MTAWVVQFTDGAEVPVTMEGREYESEDAFAEALVAAVRLQHPALNVDDIDDWWPVDLIEENSP